MRSKQDATGMWHHSIRQSDLSTFQMCPEMLRTGGGEGETDATAMGTSVHHGIEHYLKLGGEYEEMVQACVEKFSELWPDCRKVQVSDVTEAVDKMRASLKAFWEGRHYFERGGMIEHQFHIPDVHVDQFRKISFEGTMDYYLPKRNMIFDWKTTAKSYDAQYWLIDRYAVQPTMYCFAAGRLFGKVPSFTFARLPKDGLVMEMTTVERDEADFASLIAQAVNLATLVESDLPTWPMMPTNWHCSAKWCATMRRGECLGEHMQAKRWNLPYVEGVPFKPTGETNGNH